jgi:hypothetical protein
MIPVPASASNRKATVEMILRRIENFESMTNP